MGLSPTASRGIHLAVLVLVLSLCAVVLLSYLAQLSVHPWIASGSRFITFCPYRAWTGTPCPLCGTITGFLLLLKGEWTSSLQANFLAFALAPTIVVQLIYRSLGMRRAAIRWREEVGLLGFGLLSAMAAAGIRWFAI